MNGSDLVVRLRIRTGEIVVKPGGLPIRSDYEDVVAVIPFSFPFIPPSVHVEHGRFVGHPHVLQGAMLCIYLDPGQEWHPKHGIVGFLNQLWSWLKGAAGGLFKARTALYHPVGGVLHATAGTPTVVVRAALDMGAHSMALRWLHRRTPARLDLVRLPSSSDDLATAVVALPAPLRYGAGSTLGHICSNIDHIGQPRDAFLHALAMTAARNPPHAPVHFVLGVPHAGSSSPDRETNYLVCGRVNGQAIEPLRKAAKEKGALLQLPRPDIPYDTPVEWCSVSEERRPMTTRRDHQRPVNAFNGANVVLWGCGGLGSWAGEFLVRAGAVRITLCDPANVTGALLVRQDYTEFDVGTTKAEALARRLEALNDTVAIKIVQAPFSLLAEGQLPECDVLIDATVNNAVAFGLGMIWAGTMRCPLVARMSTDRATSTLGLLTIARPGTHPTPEDADLLTRQGVMAEPSLEPYRCFWDPPGPDDEVNPAPGCSVPTFHGSAADLAAVTGSMISLLGPHLLTERTAGSHLIALPHSHFGMGGHRWVDFISAQEKALSEAGGG
ncbi:MAG: ThiF family adenylyltransferase [Pseudonocardiaceae bacterium]